MAVVLYTLTKPEVPKTGVFHTILKKKTMFILLLRHQHLFTLLDFNFNAVKLH